MTLFCFLVTLTLLAFDQPERAKGIAATVGNKVDGWWRDKELWVSGADLVSRKDIDGMLPLDKGVIWWLLNEEQIETTLRSNPLVAKAAVNRCPGKWWGCFSISVEERQPDFLVLVGSKAWLVGGDGGVLTPLPTQRAQSIARGEKPAEFMGRRVPIIEGLPAEEDSPDLLRGRLSQAKRSIEILADALAALPSAVPPSAVPPSAVRPATPGTSAKSMSDEGADFQVERMSFRQRHDMAVRFRGQPYLVTFDVSQPDKWEAQLADQADRFVRLLEEIGERAAEVREIDLAFDSVAVVRPASALRPPAEEGLETAPAVPPSTVGRASEAKSKAATSAKVSRKAH